MPGRADHSQSLIMCGLFVAMVGEGSGTQNRTREKSNALKFPSGPPSPGELNGSKQRQPIRNRRLLLVF